MKEKRRFNIVDVVLIALVALVAVGALALRDRSTGADAARDTAPMRFTVEFTKAPADMAAQMKIGSGAYRSTDGAYLGKIVDAYCVPHVENEYSPVEGRFIRYEFQESYDVYLTIENDAYSTMRDIVFGTVPAKVCGEMAVKGQGFARVGYVVSLDTMGADVVESTETGTGGLELTYVIRLDDLRPMLLGNVHVGDRMFERLTGGLLGEVVEVWQEPHRESHVGPDGAVYVEKEESWDLFVRLKGRAVEKPDGYYLGGNTELKVGASVNVDSQYFERTGTFYALESIEAVS